MARLDDLVAQIKDQALRQKFEAALADLKRRQRFGLVFEEHIPESTCLVTFPIVVGATVQRRTDQEGKRVYRVKSVDRCGKATIEPDGGGEVEAVPAKDLIAVKRFGEPIFPSLTSLGGIQNGPPNKPTHAVINGENFHALQLFVYLYQGQADCIYIDPPYNTGAKDWKYNNRYVDKNDTWRSSKWLSMMEKRLRLAKRLLKPDGVLICTIDEHEANHLGMLLERLFKEYLLYMVTIVINPKGREKANFAPVEEFAFFVVPNIGRDVILRAPAATPTLFDKKAAEASDEAADAEGEPDGEEEEVELAFEECDAAEDVEIIEVAEPTDDGQEWEHRHARRRGGGAESSSYREKRHNQFYPIFIDEKAKKVVRCGESIPLDQEPEFKMVGGLRPIWPIDTEGRHRVWAFIPSSMQQKIDAGNVFLGRYHKKRDDWTINYRVPKKSTRKLKTVWWDKSHDAGTHGTELIKKLLGQPGLFPFPKSLYAVRDCLAAVVRDRPNALIIDFFAGSGTTLHATSLLNLEDNGNRRSIIVTNNEVSEKLANKLRSKGVFPGDPEFEQHGIFSAVTRPRVEATITGQRASGTAVPGRLLDGTGKPKGRPFAKGFPENVEFFRIDYLDPDDVDLGTQFEAILPSLWLAAGGVGPRDTEAATKGFSMPAGARYAVVFDESAFRRFRKALQSRPDVTHVFIVTDSEEAYAEVRASLPPHVKSSMLYRDYLQNFRINTRQSV